MDALLAVMREHAASPDEDSDVDPGQDWHWDVNSDASRIRAYTKSAWPDPDMAWQAAIALRDIIVALGYELRHECEIGIAPEAGSRYDSPIHQWRGRVSLVFATD